MSETMMLDKVPEAVPYMQKVVVSAKLLLEEKHDITQVRLRPVNLRSARFSLPCVVEGERDGKPTKMFTKIVGSSDHFTAVISQFMKNMYLEKQGRQAIFEVPPSALDIVRQQYDGLLALINNGFLTSRPLGYYDIDGIRAMLVLEFVTGRPFSKVDLTPALAEAAFDVMRRMHQRGLNHGDIKLDNLVLAPDGEIFLMDVGSFRAGVPLIEGRAYDIASMLCALSERMPVEQLLEAGVHKYPLADREAAVPYVDLSRNRPDFSLPDEIIDPIKQRLSGGAALERQVR